MTFNPPEIREFEKKYVKRLETFSSRAIDNTAWWEALNIFFDWQQEEDEGPPEERQQRMEDQRRFEKYAAYLLRHDLDRVFYGYPYPQPASERMDAVWPLAEYLYTNDDPAGFLGPNSAELVYVLKAMEIRAVLGDSAYDDILDKLRRSARWYTFERDVPSDPAFEAWLVTDEYFTMFKNRLPHPDLDYERMWADNEDDRVYAKAFIKEWNREWRARGKAAREADHSH